MEMTLGADQHVGQVPGDDHDASATAAGLRGAGRRHEGEQWNRRRVLERHLHDGPALRIAAAALGLGLLGQKLSAGDADLHHDIDDLQGQLHAVLQELRAIADQIYPPLLYEAGLGPALRELADRKPFPVRVDASDARYALALEGAAYFVVCDLLAGSRVGAETVEVRVGSDDDAVTLQIAHVHTGDIAALADQIRRLGGTVAIDGGGSSGSITVRLPCG